MTAAGISISKIDTSDGRLSGDLKRAYLRLFNDDRNLKFLSFSGLPFSDATVSQWLSTSAQSGIQYHGAFTGEGRIVGVAVTKRDEVQGFELLAIAVDEAYRRSGIGKRLVEDALALAVSEGYRAVDVSVFADNRPMLMLTICLGFIPVRMGYHLRFDGVDLVYLKKYL